ncbi:MAG TPA: TolC family protein [Gemmatimonadota bacterium]|jgi:outer membrane protein TolC|nr:TolC family protein [Gemmatimonadota bacterium]
MSIVRSLLPVLAALALLAPTAGAQEPAPSDTVALSLRRALDLGRQANPRVRQAGYQRSAAGAGLWEAYGNLLPHVSLQGNAQRFGEGTFTFLGGEFETPVSYTTSYQWDFTHSLLDAGRDLFRIRAARADAREAVASYDLEWLNTRADIQSQYLEARRETALAAQAEREVERLREHLRLAEARYEAGEVTRSDVLEARLELGRGEVDVLEARQRRDEALLALRRLLGGELESGPIRLTSDFQVFDPPFDVEGILARAYERHPSLREIDAQEEADAAGLWIARSAYLPTLQFQYGLSRSVVDSLDFRFSDFDERGFYAFSLSWELFDGFTRHHEASRANAALQSARAERELRRLEVEEGVRVAESRLRTARAAHRTNQANVELATEDLRLGQGRYETGAGSFVDLLDARVRANEAETELIAATYDFYQALVELERASGLDLFPEEALP